MNNFLRPCVLVFVLVLGLNATCQSVEPISEQQLLAWAIGGMTEDHMLAKLKERRLKSYDEPFLKALQAAGARGAVLSKIKQDHSSQASPDAAAAVSVLSKAAMAQQHEDYKLAYKYVAEALTSDPNNVDLHFAQGGILRAAEEWEESAREFRRAVQLLPDFADAQQGLSYIYYRMGDGNRAAAAARQALKLQPNDSDAHKLMGLALAAQDNLDGALSEYAEALRLNPASSSAYYDRGIVLDKKQDFAGALAAYQKATELKPGEWFYWNNMGLTLDHKGDSDGAIAAYLKAKDLNPNALEVRQNLGATYCETEQHAQAIKEFRELLKMDPTWNMARRCLFESLRAAGETDSAMKVAEESLRYEPEDEDMLVNLGELYGAKDRYSEAELLFQRAVNVAERDSGPYSTAVANALNRRALVLAYEKKFREADVDFKRAIAIVRKADADTRKEYLGPMLEQQKAMLQEWHANPQPDAQPQMKSAKTAKPIGVTAQPKQAAATAPSAVPPTPEARWQAEISLGRKAVFERRFADAEIALGKAAKDATAIVPLGNQVVMSMQELAGVYLQEQKFDLAEETLKQAIAKSEEKFGKDSLQNVMPLDSLATLYMIQAKFHDAELVYTRNLKIVEASVGPRDPQLGMALDNLAGACSSQRMFEQAEPLLKKYLTITEEFYGADSQDAAVPIDHLGALYINWHKYDQAEPLYRRALAIHEKQFGTNSPMLNGTLYSLAEILRNLGRPAEAQVLEARREALSNSKKN